jgi:hypothetical protein
LCVGSSNWNSLYGCPDGCLFNLFNAIKNIPKNRPIGLLLCEFTGALLRSGFSFNLNSIFMFAGPSWNQSIEMVLYFRSFFIISITNFYVFSINRKN